MFKKKILSFFILSVLAFSMFAVVGSVDAVSVGDAITGTGSEFVDVTDRVYSGTEQSTTIAQYISIIINAILGLLGVIFLILILYAGFLWMTAAGNDDQVGKAKKILIQAIIGIIIVTASYAISAFVISAVTQVQVQ